MILATTSWNFFLFSSLFCSILPLLVAEQLSFDECRNLLRIVEASSVIELKRFLKGRSSELNFASCKLNGRSAFFIAAASCSHEFVQTMVKSSNKATLQSKTENEGFNAIQVASKAGSADMLKVLLQAGLDANYVAPGGMTALFIASLNGNKAFVEKLLSKITEYTLNMQIDDIHGGSSALIVAVQQNQPKIVKLLLDAKADVSLRDANQMTALDYSIVEDRVEIFKIIMAYLKTLSKKNKYKRQYNELIWNAIRVTSGQENQTVTTMLYDLLIPEADLPPQAPMVGAAGTSAQRQYSKLPRAIRQLIQDVANEYAWGIMVDALNDPLTDAYNQELAVEDPQQPENRAPGVAVPPPPSYDVACLMDAEQPPSYPDQQ